MDLISNVVRGGPDTEPGLPLLMLGGEGSLSLYQLGNIAVDRWGRGLQTEGRYTASRAQILRRTKGHLDLSTLEVAPAEELEALILTHVGARPWDRDAHDARVLADAAEGRGRIINSQDDVGGYPVFDERHQPFDPSAWDMRHLAPRQGTNLDASARAPGT